MTRYLCGHPSHVRGDAPEPVDVTPQVRLERMFPPRALAYLAFTEEVLDRVQALPETDPVERTRSVLRILTGDPSPHDGPLVLVDGSRVERPPGLYQIDDLRTTEPAVGHLLTRLADPGPPGRSSGHDVVVLGDAEEYGSLGTSAERVGTAAPADQRTRALPQGVYSVIEVAQRLASARPGEDDLVEAVRRTAPYAAPLDMRTEPWRVIVECPVPSPDGKLHPVLFTGTGEPEPPVVYGVLPPARDKLLEDAAAVELNPPLEVRRAELRLKWLLLGIAAVTIALALLAWPSGGLGFAVREMPLWLGLAAVLVSAAIGAASYGLLAPILVRGNPHDLLTVRDIYQRRLRFLWQATVTAAALFLAALLVVLLPPLFVASASPPIPSPRIAFETTGDITVAHVSFLSKDLGRGDHLHMEARTFTSGTDARGVTIGRATATGTSSGTVRMTESLAINGDARFLAIRVWFGDLPLPTCTPRAAADTGCTIVTVPQPGFAAPAVALGAVIRETTVGASTATSTTTTPTTTTPTPTASATPTFPTATP